MTGLSKKQLVSFRFIIYEYNIVFLCKRFYSSFDQNFYVFERFRFVSISNLFDIESFIIEERLHFYFQIFAHFASNLLHIFLRNVGQNKYRTR